MKTIRTLAIAALAVFSAASSFAQGSIQPVFPQITGKDFARTFPYSMAGQVFFLSGGDGYSGSGTVIRASSVLTAAHNLYDSFAGWSTDVSFVRAAYGGTNLGGEKYASRIFILGGYRDAAKRYGADSVRAFSSDMGGLRFDAPVAGGSYAGWQSNVKLLTGTSYNIALGYGGEEEYGHDGEDLLYVEPPLSFYKIYGAFYENDTCYIEAGMSGGPVFALDARDNQLYVAGVVVSASSEPITGGIRIINSTAASFIKKYLR